VVSNYATVFLAEAPCREAFNISGEEAASSLVENVLY
jgi:hypothetical protein